MFEQLRARLWPAISDVAISIEHVGSTSVPGLAAKPVIDLDIVAVGDAQMRTAIDRLQTLGYRHRGDLGVQGREAFARPEGSCEHHLYACVAGAQGLRNHLAVRDYLRQHPSAVLAYGELKKDLARRFADDIDAYIDGKTAFLLKILADTAFSQHDLDQIRGINSPKR